MRKAGIAAFLILSVVATQGAAWGSAAPAKIGGSCITPKQSTVVKGVKLVCTNVNSRLNLWQKAPTTSPTAIGETNNSQATAPQAPSNVAIPTLSPVSAFVSSQTCELNVPQNDESGSLSFQRQTTYMKTSGTVNIAVVFVSFTDAIAKPSDMDEWVKVQEPNATKFYDASSYGKLHLNFIQNQKIYPLNKDSGSYNLPHNGAQLIQDAALASQADFDYSKIDELVVVIPSNSKAPDYGASGVSFTLAGKAFTQSVYAMNINPDYKGEIDTNFYTHEFGHTLGLIHPTLIPNGQNIIWDVMFHDDINGAPDLFGWEKFVLGWISPDQVDCIDGTKSQSVSALLEAAGTPSSNTKMAVIKLSDTKAIVVESRHRDSIDGLTPSEEGALVYMLDVSKASNQAAITILYTNGKFRTPSGTAPQLVGTLNEGQSVTSGNIKVTENKHVAIGDYITVLIS
jgi:M6 family metalloprotease-like protein